jgi:hypothetical protein
MIVVSLLHLALISYQDSYKNMILISFVERIKWLKMGTSSFQRDNWSLSFQHLITVVSLIMRVP